MATIISDTICHCQFDLEANLAEAEYAAGTHLSKIEREAVAYDLIKLTQDTEDHTPLHMHHFSLMRLEYFASWAAQAQDEAYCDQWEIESADGWA